MHTTCINNQMKFNHGASQITYTLYAIVCKIRFEDTWKYCHASLLSQHQYSGTPRPSLFYYFFLGGVALQFFVDGNKYSGLTGLGIHESKFSGTVYAENKYLSRQN